MDESDRYGMPAIVFEPKFTIKYKFPGIIPLL